MGFIDETVNIAKETFDVIGKKTDEVISVQKLKLNERTIKNKLDALYMELGKQCFKQFSEDEKSVPFAEETGGKITEKLGELNKIREDICKAKGGKCCKDCKTFNEPSSEFCKKCGKPF